VTYSYAPRTFAVHLRQFARSVDTVDKATFDGVRELVIHYSRRELGEGAYFELLREQPSQGRPERILEVARNVEGQVAVRFANDLRRRLNALLGPAPLNPEREAAGACGAAYRVRIGARRARWPSHRTIPPLLPVAATTVRVRSRLRSRQPPPATVGETAGAWVERHGRPPYPAGWTVIPTARGRAEMMRRRRRMIGGLCVGLVAWLCTVAVNGAPVFASAGRAPAPAPVTPNRFDPTSRAASVTAGHPPPAAPASATRIAASGSRPAAHLAAPAAVALEPARPVRLASGDAAMQVDVPAGAVTASDVRAAGGAMSLLVRQIAPASGGSGGGSGVVSFGTW
jgi:hypothetical protein